MSKVQDVYIRELATIKGLLQSRSKYFLIAFIIGFVLLLAILFYMFSTATNQREELLKQQEIKLDELTKQQKEIAEKDRQRDSVLYETYLKNKTQREADLSNAKKKSNENIDRIFNPDFNADSIKRWWADN